MSNFATSSMYKQLCHELIDTWDWAAAYQSKEFAQFLINQLRNDLRLIEERRLVPARRIRMYQSRSIYREMLRIRRNKTAAKQS